MKTISTIFALLTLSLFTTGFSGSVIITGKVTDETGQPFQGVKVKDNNSSEVAETDINGYYSIKISVKTKYLVFSRKGYETVFEKISNRTVINISMNPVNNIEKEQVIPDKKVMDSDQRLPVTGVALPHRKSSATYRMAGGVMAAYDQSGWYNGNFNTEGYSTIHENGYKDVLHNPLSTFSIDVDRASYSNVRRFINHGQKPPVDAVRIEEMINYFNYGYPEPGDEHPFSVFTEIAGCPWNNDHYLMHIGLKGESIDRENLPPSNLVFLLDVSGSMNSPDKLPLLKSAFRLLVNELRPEDRVSIVVYAGAAGVVLEPTGGNRKEEILQAIDRLSAGGSTAGGQGLILAYKLASENYVKEGNNRIILATDGDFNVGISSNAEMERLIEKKRDEGIFITVLGFGMDNYKDDKMEIIADRGNGNYAYIDNIQEARKVLVSEFGGTLFTIAKDVKLQIEFNPARIKSYRLIGYENRLLNEEDFNDDKKDAGEMGSGHTVTALYELVPAGSEEETPSVDPLKYQSDRPLIQEGSNNEYLTVKIRYKKPGEDKSLLLDIPFGKNVVAFGKASENLRFSASVAAFGMILRDSGYKGNASLESVIETASDSKGADEEGYRGEFIRLVKTLRDINQGL